MRLLNTETGQFVDKDPADDETVYAILSHTWDTERGEQTYKELKNIQQRYGNSKSDASSSSRTPRPYTPLLNRIRGRLSSPLSRSIWNDPELSPKIRDACRVARENGYRYIWIDSCCIDKSSSSELSEAINSMYDWYGRADMCYAYLADVSHEDDHHEKRSRFRKSRWFTRGWTLQELIAPVNVEFFSEDWALIGSKHTLVELVESITKIDDKALLHSEPPDAFSVAQRLSWAAKRETTRVEDKAYSLLGIFDINMPTLYGEGDRAFRRLQEQIMQRIPDQSLFAWGEVYLPESQPLLNSIPPNKPINLTAQEWGGLSSKTPDNFQDNVNIHYIHLPASHHHEIVYTLTSYGIRAQFQMIPLTSDLLSEILHHNSELKLELPGNSRWYLAILGCEHTVQPGYLLGKVCHVPPSQSGVNFIHSGYIDFDTTKAGVPEPDLLPLSPETIKRWHPQTELQTVYIPHPDRKDLLSKLRRQRYTMIKLVLLRETCDALHSQGYLANLRDPDISYPTTHWLTLSKDKHIITIEFQHTLENGGEWFTIHGEVKASGSSVQVIPGPDSDQVHNRCTVYWRDVTPWSAKLQHASIRSSSAGTKTLTLDLGLKFTGKGVYILDIDLNNVLPASSAPDSGVDWTMEAEKKAEENA